MRNHPFDKPGQFYRGNTHAHSTRSDGSLSPAELASTYRDRGYDFIAVTDHYMERFGFPVTDTTDLRTRGTLHLHARAGLGRMLKAWHPSAYGSGMRTTRS